MTHEFERSLLNGIPVHEAANFFLRIKRAGWTDAPDETGTLEGQFAAPIEQVIATISEVAAAKFKLMVAYHIYAESMRGVAQHACAEVFHEHAEMERAAAEAYLKRAAVLGSGPVHLPEIETPPASSDPVGILMILARAEQEAIALQTELKQMVGETNPLGFQIEAFMVEDQHHLDELWQMLPQDVARTPVIDQAPAGAELPAPEVPEAPVEEAVAASAQSPEPTPAQKEAFARGLRKLAGIDTEIAGVMSPEDKAIQSKLKGLKDADRAQEARQVLGGPLRDFGKDPLPETSVKDPRKLSPLQEYDVAHRINQGDISPEDAKILRDHVNSGGGPLFKGRNGQADGGLPPKLSPGMGRGFKIPPKILGLSALAGAGLGALSGTNMSDTRTRHLKKGGPISRFTADHPIISGALQGGVAMPLSVAGAQYGLLPAMAGAVGPAAVAGMIDNGLRTSEKRQARQTAKMASAFREGLRKLGFSPPEPGLGTDPGAAPAPDAQQAVVPQPSMGQPGVQPPMATPPGGRQYAPANYLEAEETGRRVQEENEAQFYRGKAEEATGQIQSMGTQVADIQSQLDQLSAQAAESQSQIMAANEEAVRANDQMLNQATLAARMRMGMQQLRAQMMEIASQDPEQLAAAAGGPTPMDVGMQAQQAQAGAAPPGGDPSMGGAAPGDQSAEPGAQPGTPGASPDPGAPPGSPAGGSGGPPGASAAGDTQKSDGESPPAKKDTGGETTVSIKKGSAKTSSIYAETMGKIPYAAGGAVLGAGAGYLDAKRGKEIPNLRERVDALKGQQDGGFGKSIELAQAQLSLGQAEEARANPGRSAIKGGLLGAGLGAGLSTAVPAAISGGKELFKNLSTVASNMRGA